MGWTESEGMVCSSVLNTKILDAFAAINEVTELLRDSGTGSDDEYAYLKTAAESIQDLLAHVEAKWGPVGAWE